MVVADCRREAKSMPATAQSVPMEPKTMKMIFLTLMPLSSAASGLPPMA